MLNLRFWQGGSALVDIGLLSYREGKFVMQQINNPMEIFKLLNGSNCKDCNEQGCLAFAVAVFKERKPIHACPHLEKEVLDRYAGAVEKSDTVDEYKAQAIESLKQKVAEIDLCEAAQRLGARFSNDKLDLKIFGKQFGVDTQGDLSSEVHINAYMVVPALNYRILLFSFILCLFFPSWYVIWNRKMVLSQAFTSILILHPMTILTLNPTIQ